MTGVGEDVVGAVVGGGGATPVEVTIVTVLPRSAQAAPRDSPATLGIDTMSPDCTMPLGSAKSRNAMPAEARSMICFQIGAAMVAPKISPG